MHQKKLQLSKETLRRLTPEDMTNVVGGKPTPAEQSYNGSCDSCTVCRPCPDPSIANTCGCSQVPCL